MTAQTATGAMAPDENGPPATVTVRRSWALAGAALAVAVIVALSIALAAMASDGDDRSGDYGFPQGSPGLSEGIAPPQGMTPPEGIALPEGMAPPQGVAPRQGGGD